MSGVLKTLITESMNSFYRIARGDSATNFKFETEHGEQYEIDFTVYSNPYQTMEYKKFYFDLVPANASKLKVVDVEFTLDGKYKYLGGRQYVSGVKSNPMKVFATVVNTAIWFATTKNIDVIFFSGESKLGSVYKRFLQRFVPSGYTYTLADHRRGDDELMFMVYKKGLELE